MINLRNYVWTLPSLIILGIIGVLSLLQSCRDGGTVKGNPDIAMKSIERSMEGINGLWMFCWFNLVLCGILSVVFYIQIQEIRKQLKIYKGINV